MAAPSRLLVWLIGLAIALNYVDRGAVSVAAPLVQDAFGLNATGYGAIVSAFYWTYVPALVLAGWLADRVSVAWLMAGGVAIWGIATACMGLAGSFGALVALRLLMGLGEGAAFPCGSKLIARVPEGSRGLANVALSGGIALGPLIGTLAGAALIKALGWREMFFVFGAVTLLWLLPWAWASAAAGRVAAPVSAQAEPAPSWPRLFAQPQLWGMSVLHFTGSNAIYFMLAWLPPWLVKVRGYDIADMALLTGAFYLSQALGGLAGAWWCDQAIRAGGDGSAKRRQLLFGCVAGCTAGIVALPAMDGTAALLACITLTGLAFGPVANLLFTIGQTLAGPAAAGRWMGMQTSIGNLSGVVGPVITGLIVDHAGYLPAFWVTAGLSVIGAIAFALTVPRVAPLPLAARA